MLRRAGAGRPPWPRATAARASAAGLLRGRDGERGSVTVFTAVFAIAVIFLLGLILDGGMALNAKERAADIAGQAARAAADQLNIAALRAGRVVIDPGRACPAARNLVSAYAAGVRGGVDHVISVGTPTCSINGQQATVTLTISTSPLVPGVLGGFTETAAASATAECGINTGGVCP
jgi:Flp pilus assembly protein TadG